MAIAFLSLGCNIGDCYDNLTQAVARLDRHDRIRVKQVSSVYRTEPVGGVEQPDFLNLVLELDTGLSPRQLLEACGEIETGLGGRKGRVHMGPRTIDLDILLFEQVEIEEWDLQIPHPAMEQRAFVLVPLAEIAPQWQLPGGDTVAAAAAKVAGAAGVERQGSLNFDRRSNS